MYYWADDTAATRGPALPVNDTLAGTATSRLEIPKTLFGGKGDPRHTTNKHSTYIIASRNIT